MARGTEFSRGCRRGGGLYRSDGTDAGTVLQLIFGGQKVTVNKAQTLALPLGSYGALKAEQGATLNLTSGYYTFDEFFIEKEGRAHIDLTQGLIVIDVKVKVDLKDNVQMTAVVPPGGTAEDILVRVVGNTVTLRMKLFC